MSADVARKRGTSAQPITLHAGPLAAVLEHGSLHTLTAHGVEIWRGVMFLYRDAAWRTPTTIVGKIGVVADDASFHVAFDARCAMVPGISWRTVIDGRRDGSIHFDVAATIDEALATNRTGLCLLHPLSTAGARLDVEHADGRVSQSTFPTLVSPWQPFTNIRALRHEFMPGCWAHARFDGDVFEMEDQRNFSDASFKTYSRSNLMPRPYRLERGETVRQSLTLTLEGHGSNAAPQNARATRASRSRAVRLDVASESSGRLPGLGLALPSGDAGLDARPALWHVAIDRTASVAMPDDAWRAIERAAKCANVAIELLLADDADGVRECAELAGRLQSIGTTVESVAIFPTTRAFVTAARAAFPRSLVGGGTPWFFTHLNRARLPSGLDFVTFRTCPIVHVADDRSVMQSLATLPAIVATLRARHPGVRFRVAPSAISMTVNPFGPWAEAGDSMPVAMARSDPRDRSRFGAAWALGCFARFAVGGADVVSLASPAAFDALAPLASIAGAPLRDVAISDERIVALAVETETGVDVWIANTTAERMNLDLRVPGRASVRQPVDAFDFARVTLCPAGSEEKCALRHRDSEYRD